MDQSLSFFPPVSSPYRQRLVCRQRTSAFRTGIADRLYYRGVYNRRDVQLDTINISICFKVLYTSIYLNAYVIIFKFQSVIQLQQQFEV